MSVSRSDKDIIYYTLTASLITSFIIAAISVYTGFTEYKVKFLGTFTALWFFTLLATPTIFWNKRKNLKYMGAAHAVINYFMTLLLIWELPTLLSKNLFIRVMFASYTIQLYSVAQSILLKHKEDSKNVKKAYKEVSTILILLTTLIVYFIITQNVPEIFTI